MLYKKYHRSYVRKFRRGKKVIRLGCFISYKATVTRLVVSNRDTDTFSTYISIDVFEDIIKKEDHWVIIYSEGSINRNIIVSK